MRRISTLARWQHPKQKLHSRCKWLWRLRRSNPKRSAQLNLINKQKKVAVIGAGFVGCCTAWLLSKQGFDVTIISPRKNVTGGSIAALGLLMANVFQRSSGRNWRLRQQSMQLFSEWQQHLQGAGYQAKINRGLWLLTNNSNQWQKYQLLAEERSKQGIGMEIFNAAALKEQVELGALPPLSEGLIGGIWSSRDGQLDPTEWMKELLLDSQNNGLKYINSKVSELTQINGSWQLSLEANNKDNEIYDWLMVCAGLESIDLLAPLGLSNTNNLAMQPVLGQALELELPVGINLQQSVNWDGINLVPRPNNLLWLGATLEPGLNQNQAGSISALRDMQQLNGASPEWLNQAKVIRHWQGVRAQPVGQPAPVLEQLLPGLCLMAGHYRNGILLGPASAMWAAKLIAGIPQP
ncbi:FAD-dependent oxidoreductase [Synechococcus sp. UW140]|uniref:NAD(P)/FAD-dependent oxidoreductase n=1 Tax=Synechococcus sp. UW140 TaxID=368503 RepID=UPI003459A9C4